MTHIQFQTTAEDFALIRKIVDRAERVLTLQGQDFRRRFTMDLDALQSGICPLNLEAMLEGDNFDFIHDVCGIYNHLDRREGKLTRCFWPRFAREQ